MRSHILPRNLCFLIAFLLGLGVSLSAIKSLEASTKTSDNKKVSSILMDSYYFNSPLLSQKVKTSKATVINMDLAQVSNSTKKGQIHQIEEISYLNDEGLTVGSAVNLKEMESSLAQGQARFKQGMFYGFALMVVILNLVCFLLFEEKIFLFYSLALTFVITSFMHSDGVFQLIAIGVVQNTEAMQSTLLFIATGFSVLFVSKYLILGEFYPKLKYGAAVLLTISFMAVFTSWVAETELFTGIANTISLALTTVYFTAGILLFSKKNYAKFYVIACSIPLLFALDFFVFKKLGVDFLFTESFHLKAAAVVEMLIITYAIVYRMRAIKEEHVLRQTEMRIFLKRQEIMNRTNTEKLMQDMYLENLIMQYDLDGFEIKLLQYISEGKDNTKIARKLKTTELEIETFTKELYNKLDIGEQIQEDYRMVEHQPDYIYN